MCHRCSTRREITLHVVVRDNNAPKLLQLWYGDCLKLMDDIPDNSVDAIITDPPYAKEFLHLYNDIAVRAKRILKRGGSYLTILPHYAIPHIVSSVSEHLKFRWMLCMWQGDGPHARMAMGVEILWKPIGWWVKGAWPQGRGFVADAFRCPTQQKKMHRWQQHIAWAEYCMRFVPKGGVVVDPLMGVGTVGVACIESGRSFIGIELSEETFDIAVERLESTRKGIVCFIEQL